MLKKIYKYIKFATPTCLAIPCLGCGVRFVLRPARLPHNLCKLKFPLKHFIPSWRNLIVTHAIVPAIHPFILIPIPNPFPFPFRQQLNGTQISCPSWLPLEDIAEREQTQYLALFMASLFGSLLPRCSRGVFRIAI